MLRIALFAGLATAASERAAAEKIDEIIVTAEKQPFTLDETTSSVSVVTSKDIEAQGLRSVQDVYDRTVNVSATYGPGGFGVRGTANIGVSGAGEASTVTVYVDGAPLAPTFLHAAPTRLWDAAQVEILRGPQSTLQGLNALAGAVVIRTHAPRLDSWEGVAQATLTDEMGFQLASAFGGPIVARNLGMRLAVERNWRDGHIRNVTRDVGEDRERSTTVRGKLVWQPEALPGLTAQLGVTSFRRNGGFFNVYARTDAAGFPRRRVATDNVPNTTQVEFDALVGELSYQASERLTITSATSWSNVVEASSFDADYSEVDASFGRQRRKYRTVTQELRANFSTPLVSGVAGFFYYNRDLASRTISRTDVPTPTATIAGLLQSGGISGSQAGAIAAIYTQAMPAIRVDFDGSFPTHVRSYAAFSDLRLHLSERVSLLAGVRVDHETTSTRNSQRSKFAGTLPSPAAFGSLGPVIAQINAAVGTYVAQSNSSLPTSRETFTSVLPKAGVRFEWSNDLSTSFVVQRGYRSGGLSTNIARAQSIPYKPEYTWNYELSLRGSFLDDRLQVRANAFYVDWRDQQVTVNFGLNSFDANTVNAGRSHLHGFEVEVDHALSRSWSLFGGVGYQDTRFDTFTIEQSGAVSSLSDTVFAFAPRWTLVGGVNWQSAAGWSGNLTAKKASSSFAAVGVNQFNYRVAAHTAVNARFGYKHDHWSLHALIRNAFNQVYTIYKSPLETRAVLNEPRSIGAELRILI